MRSDLHKTPGVCAKTARNASAPAQDDLRVRKKGLKCARACTRRPACAQKGPEMRQRLHKSTGVCAKRARNALAPAQVDRRVRKNGPKCVRACTSRPAYAQKRLEMRQRLHQAGNNLYQQLRHGAFGNVVVAVLAVVAQIGPVPVGRIQKENALGRLAEGDDGQRFQRQG